MEGKQERSEGGKDLGVVADTKLNFAKHISSMINKANSVANLLNLGPLLSILMLQC